MARARLPSHSYRCHATAATRRCCGRPRCSRSPRSASNPSPPCAPTGCSTANCASTFATTSLYSISAGCSPPEPRPRSARIRRWSMRILAADPLLRIAGLSTGYGKIGVLRGIDLTVGAGEVVALLGPNGAGKTTLLRAVSGLLPWSGSVRFAGRDLAGSSPRETVRCGLAHVIEGHRVFTQLGVLDNLLLAAYDLPRGERAVRVEEVFGLFPEIAAKRHERAAALSGGQ